MGQRLLVLVRHGESEWNKKNLFTGWRDVDLTEKGIAEARRAGRALKAQGLHFDVAFTSVLKRAQKSLDLMLEELGEKARRSTSATMAISQVSTRTMPAPSGAKIRCTFGAARMTSRRPAAKA